jgi:DNA (cytosine-5)-methyltransferase 1
LKIGAVDLFCGIGGLTYGIQKAGINVVAGIDIDESCQYPYEENNKAAFIHKNISEVKGKEIKKLLRGYDVKVLVGCAPCQPFSSHQKDKKHRDTHKDWSLLYQFARIVKESKPDIVSMENVPALVEEQVFIDFVSTLRNLKYEVNYKVVNAANYGVAQNRRRLLLLASNKKGLHLIEETHLNNWNNVRNVIGKLPPVEAGEEYEQDELHQAPSLSKINIKRIKASKPKGTWRDWPEDLLLECHKKKTGKSYPSVYGRMSWDEVAPTMTTQYTYYGTGRFGHPEQNRALTMREGALLQTFPQTYKFTDEKTPICIKSITRHIGNAVPPRLGEIIGLSIASYVKGMVK